MKKEEVRIIGVRVEDRQKEAGDVQKVLTKYGCSIKTRLGLHEVNDAFCSTHGLLLLELTGDMQEQQNLENELAKVKGINLQKMYFNKQ